MELSDREIEIVDHVNKRCDEITAELGYGYEELEFGHCPSDLILALIKALEEIGIKDTK